MKHLDELTQWAENGIKQRLHLKEQMAQTEIEVNWFKTLIAKINELKKDETTSLVKPVVTNLKARETVINETVDRIVNEVKERAEMGLSNGYFTMPKELRHDILEILEKYHGVYKLSLSSPSFDRDEAEYHLGWN